MRTEMETKLIDGYHAHLYFDADTVDAARDLAKVASDKFGVEMGRVHERNVGPHLMWSCQLLCDNAQFAELLPWLALNRGDIIVFAHPQTGDDLADHRDHAIWLGAYKPLNLSIFS